MTVSTKAPPRLADGAVRGPSVGRTCRVGIVGVAALLLSLRRFRRPVVRPRSSGRPPGTHPTMPGSSVAGSCRRWNWTGATVVAPPPPGLRPRMSESEVETEPRATSQLLGYRAQGARLRCRDHRRAPTRSPACRQAPGLGGVRQLRRRLVLLPGDERAPPCAHAPLRLASAGDAAVVVGDARGSPAVVYKARSAPCDSVVASSLTRATEVLSVPWVPLGPVGGDSCRCRRPFRTVVTTRGCQRWFSDLDDRDAATHSCPRACGAPAATPATWPPRPSRWGRVDPGCATTAGVPGHPDPPRDGRSRAGRQPTAAVARPPTGRRSRRQSRSRSCWIDHLGRLTPTSCDQSGVVPGGGRFPSRSHEVVPPPRVAGSASALKSRRSSPTLRATEAPRGPRTDSGGLMMSRTNTRLLATVGVAGALALGATAAVAGAAGASPAGARATTAPRGGWPRRASALVSPSVVSLLRR